MTPINRFFLIFAGLCGALGVAASARAYHTQLPQLDALAKILLGHAPVFLCLVVLRLRFVASRWLLIAGFFLVVGTVLFCGDVSVRFLLGGSFLPYAAPIGGIALMLGWLAISVFAIAKFPSTA